MIFFVFSFGVMDSLYNRLTFDLGKKPQNFLLQLERGS